MLQSVMVARVVALTYTCISGLTVGIMGPIAESLGEQLAPLVVQEALAEIRGSSSKRWALTLIAAAVGVAVALFIMRRRRAFAGDEFDPGPAGV